MVGKEKESIHADTGGQLYNKRMSKIQQLLREADFQRARSQEPKI